MKILNISISKLSTAFLVFGLGFSFEMSASANDGFRMHSKGALVSQPTKRFTGYLYGYGGISFGGSVESTGTFSDLSSEGATIVSGDGLDPASIPINFDLRDDWNAGLGLGFYSSLLGGTRFEIEGAVDTKDVGILTYGGFVLPSIFEFRTSAVMVNFLKEIPMATATGYAGFGVGYAQTEMNGQIGGVPYNTTDSGIAWQFLMGLDVPVTERLAFFTQYRYRILDDLTFTSNFGDFSFTTDSTQGGHALLMGARVSF